MHVSSPANSVLSEQIAGPEAARSAAAKHTRTAVQVRSRRRFATRDIRTFMVRRLSATAWHASALALRLDLFADPLGAGAGLPEAAAGQQQLVCPVS